MEVVKFYKCSKEEFREIYRMLKETELFSENYIKAIENAMLNGAQMELPEEHARRLRELGLIQTVRENTYSTSKVEEESQTFKTAEVETEYTPKDNISNAEEEKENDESYMPAEIIEESESLSNENINEDESLTAKKEETKFIPESLEDLKNIPEDEVGKHYYLTPERIIESMKRINNGKTWERISQICDSGFSLEYAIKRAYQTGFYESDLSNPNFLDERIKEFLPEKNQAIQFKDLHMAAVLGTYVGYHVEKNQGDIDEISSNGENKADIAVVKFPMIMSEMPDALLEQIRKDLAKNLTCRIEELVSGSNGYRALIMLSPLEKNIDSMINDYSESLQDTEENQVVKAYISTMRSDLTGDIKQVFENLNVSMDLYSVNWNDPNSRKEAIYAIQELQGEGKEIEASNLVKEINISYNVDTIDDLNLVRAACEDLSVLSHNDTIVNISFVLSPRATLDIKLNEELNNIVNQYDNIQRDTTSEIINNGTNLFVDSAIRSALVGEVAHGGINEIDGGIFGAGALAVRGLSMAATGVMEVIRDIEDPEIFRQFGGTGGSGS